MLPTGEYKHSVKDSQMDVKKKLYSTFDNTSRPYMIHQISKQKLKYSKVMV